MTLVHGMSLHFYNEKHNSDKFYRAFVWEHGGCWYANYHWGRDGTIGMAKAKADRYHSYEAAYTAIVRKVHSKRKEGYVLLGEGTVSMAPIDIFGLGQEVGAKLHEWIGAEPLKIGDGFDFVIREPELIDDLVS